MNVVCPNCKCPMEFQTRQNPKDPESDCAFWLCKLCCLIQHNVDPARTSIADILNLGE